MENKKTIVDFYLSTKQIVDNVIHIPSKLNQPLSMGFIGFVDKSSAMATIAPFFTGGYPHDAACVLHFFAEFPCSPCATIL